MQEGARFIALMLGGAALAACQPDAAKPVPKAEASEAAVAPAAAAAGAAGAPLREWLVGSWSFEASCASDFIAHYAADGSLDNSGEMGGWADRKSVV